MPTIHLSPIHRTQHDLMCKMVEISVQPHSLDCPWYVWDQWQNMWGALMLSTCFVIGINDNNSSSSSSTCFSNYSCPLYMQLRPVQSKLLCFVLRLSCTFYWTQVRSVPCFVSQSSCWKLFKLFDLSKLLHGFLYVVRCICQMDKWIFLSCYMDLSKLIHEKNVSWIC